MQQKNQAEINESIASLAQSASPFWNSFIKHLPVPVACFDRNMNYVHCSDKWLQCYNLDTTIVGKNHLDFDNIANCKWCNFFDVALKGDVVRCARERTTAPHEDFNEWVQPTLYPYLNENGEIEGVIVFADIVTDHVVTERQLTEIQKLQSLEQMAGGIAHEINNMLQPILSFIGLIHMDIEDKNYESIGEYVDIIQSNVEKASTILRQMMFFSREKNYVLESINIREDLEGIISFSCNLLPSSIDLEIVNHLKDIKKEYTIRANTIGMQQIMINLLRNAQDAMQNMDHIRIIMTTQDDQYLKLTVQDTGSGMPEHVQDRIFNPFYTTKDVGKGTGMGLSVVKGIIESWNGSISCDSEIGVGTTFTLLIPLQLNEKNGE